MLDLLEALLLLAVHEEKGILSFSVSSRIDLCLSGALLMELELAKRIKADRKSLTLLDRAPTGNPRLDSLIELMDRSKRVHSPTYWVTKTKGNFKHLRRDCLDQLVDRGFLREEDRQILWIFSSTAYPLRDDRPKKEIRDQIRQVILRGETPSPRLAHLIALVSACGLTHTLFDPDERRDAKKKMKALVKQDVLVQAILKAIQGSQAGAYAGSI